MGDVLCVKKGLFKIVKRFSIKSQMITRNIVQLIKDYQIIIPDIPESKEYKRPSKRYITSLVKYYLCDSRNKVYLYL